MSHSEPIACTLTGEQFKERLASIQELTRDALRHAERRDLVLKLFYDLAAADRVHAMVRKEQACCRFLAFELREEASGLRLTIMAPEEAREVADRLFEQFIARVPDDTATGCRGSQGTCNS
jgi:hypothetical protein